MAVGNVSFKNMVAVTGSPRKMRKFEEVLRTTPCYKNRDIMQTDVTSHYRYASPTGLIAESVQNGQSVYVYATGDDLNNIKSHEDGWDTLDGILSNLKRFISVDNCRPEDAVKKLVDN